MSDQNRIDRRSALRKAATAGVIAWTAPTVLSTTVTAGTVGACTPKCAPQFVARTALIVQQLCYDAKPTDIVQIDGKSIHDCPCQAAGIYTIAPRGWDSKLTIKRHTQTQIFISDFTPNTLYKGFIDYYASCFDRQAREIRRISAFPVSFTTLPEPCTDGFEITIPASAGTVSDPTCKSPTGR